MPDKLQVRKPALLVVEDDPGLQKQLKWSLDEYQLIFAESRDAAIAAVRRHEPQVMLQDLGLPPDADGISEGMATLEQTLSLVPAIKIVVVTGQVGRDIALEAVRRGAYDFYQKPFDIDVLKLTLARAFRIAELEAENRRLATVGKSSSIDGLIAVDDSMLRLCRMVEKVAPTDVSVLILGESGTGKELLARALHNLSGRRDGRFVAINCAAIPENLLESELFGHEKGAFTGAHKQTHGKVELAQDGTLFLDEIGDMPAALQAKMLRFLQERVLERIGGREEIAVDVRVVCATNQDIARRISQGQFREDLYYRVGEIILRVPALRERAADILVLANAFLRRFAIEFRQPVRGFSVDALDALTNHSWPGNVRELENKVKGAVIMAEGPLITSGALGLPLVDEGPLNLREVRTRAERRALDLALSRADGNLSRAAEMLGVSRPTFYDLLERHGLRGSTE